MTDEIQWLPHDGGENPVREGETLTYVRFRNGLEYTTGCAKYWEWAHNDGDYDIIAYAVTPPRREPTALPDIAAQIRQRIAEIDASNPERVKLVKALEALV